jgi:exopolyphosphatase/guanosine-5'-triphosphate,3'-diphosphate pyrophosphatase
MEGALAQPEVAWQLMCLRLAVIQCHARAPVDQKAVDLARQGDSVRLVWTPGWAAEHPRALHLLREEADAWSRSGVLNLVLPAD